MNVLVTSAGRRDYLVDYFQRTQGVDRVIAADASPLATALSAADVAEVVPPFLDPDYVPALLDVVRRHEVRLLLTVSDHDALVLAGHVERFRELGCLAMVADPKVVRLVMDKRWLGAFCRRVGIATPRIFTGASDALEAIARREASFPLVVKPRFGSASLGTFVVDRPEELDAAITLSTLTAERTVVPGTEDVGQLVLVQEHIAGPEFGIDVVNDPEGHHVATLSRAKLSMRGGETDKAETLHDPVLSAVGRRIGQSLGHRGCLDCDVILRDGVPVLLDANPRIGGGYPFVHEAGADLPGAYVAWANGRDADPDCFSYWDGVIGSKTSRVVRNRVPAEVGS